MISIQKTTNFLVPRDLANSKTWHATHVSCLLHVSSFTWNCSPVCLLIMTAEKPYKGSPLNASYPVETFLPQSHFVLSTAISFQLLTRICLASGTLWGSCFWSQILPMTCSSTSAPLPQEGTEGDWGRGLYSHGILTLPHNGPLSSCFWISHCTLPGCSHAIINKYLCGKRLLWKCLGEVWGYLASVDKVDFMIYFQTFHQQ